MKQLSKSDILNIETYKGLLAMLQNDIVYIKGGTATPKQKANLLMEVSRQRSKLIQNATANYPHINWVSEAIEERTAFQESEHNTIRLKAEYRAEKRANL